MAAAGTVRRAMIALLLLSLIWGYNYVVMKEVIRYVGPFDFAALRTAFGAVVLFLALILLRRPMPLVAARQMFLLGVLQTAAFSALLQWALVEGSAGKTAVLVYTMPFWTIALAWGLLRERIRPMQWLASALAGVGLILVVEPWASQGALFSNLLAIGSGLTWAMSSVLVKRIRRDHAVDLLSMTAWQMLFGAVALCLLAAVLPSPPIQPTPYFFGAVLFNAVFATGLAWLLWMYVLEHLSTAMAGLSVLGIPLVGVLAGWLELGERPNGSELAGMLLIGGALVLLSLWALWSTRRSGVRG